jgi:hypothetical protein
MVTGFRRLWTILPLLLGRQGFIRGGLLECLEDSKAPRIEVPDGAAAHLHRGGAASVFELVVFVPAFCQC